MITACTLSVLKGDLELFKMLVDRGEIMATVAVGQLQLHLLHALIQSSVVLSDLPRAVVLKQLQRFDLRRVFQLQPALPNLTELLLNHGAQLWLLRHQPLTFLGKKGWKRRS